MFVVVRMVAVGQALQPKAFHNFEAFEYLLMPAFESQQRYVFVRFQVFFAQCPFVDLRMAYQIMPLVKNLVQALHFHQLERLEYPSF